MFQRIVLAMAVLLTILPFQNFTWLNPGAVSRNRELNSPTPIRDFRDSYLAARAAQQPAQISELRRELYNSHCRGNYEYCFEGAGLPGEGLLPFQLWDNPIDDDWRFYEGGRTEMGVNGQSRLPALDFFRSARVHKPKSSTSGACIDDIRNGPSWILKHMPDMNDGTGADIEIQLRILPTSQDKGVGLTYMDSNRQFSVGFSRDRIYLDEGGGARFFTNLSRATDMTRFRTLRILKPARGQGLVEIFDVETGERLLAGRASEIRAPGAAALISFGMFFESVNPSDCARRVPLGQYDLAHLRLGRANRLAVSRTPPSLPQIESLGANSSWRQVQLTDKLIQGGGMVTGILPSARPLDAFSLEWSMRMDRDFSGEHRLSYSVRSDGSSYPGLVYTIILSDNQVRTANMGKPVGSVAFSHDLNMSAWQCFRLVKPAGETHAHLYVGNNPIPLLVDIAPGYNSAETFNGMLGSRLHMGVVNTPTTSAAAWGERGLDFPGAGASGSPLIQMGFLRYSNQALAPGRAPCEGRYQRNN